MSDEGPLALLIRTASSILRSAGISAPQHEAELLLGYLTGLDRVFIKSHPERPLEEAVANRFLGLCHRRITGEPLAYLVGEREFWSMTMQVDRRVLIPRPETEHLVEAALAHLPFGPLSLVDYGTGSGCISLALARERPKATILAVDVDTGALEVAAGNIRQHRAANQVQLIQGESLAVLGGQGWVRAVVSNPPYIPQSELAELPGTVRDFEPATALDGGPDGLALIRPLIREAARLVAAGGFLALEIHSGLASETRDLLKPAHWRDVQIACDLAGLPRVILAFRRP